MCDIVLCEMKVMKMYKFNIELLRSLPELLDITVAKLAVKAKVSQPAMTRYLQGETAISVQTLKDLCNAMRIPIHYFIYEGGVVELPTLDRLIIPSDQWHPILWDHDAIDRIFGAYGGRIYWKDVSAVMGTSSQKAHGRFSLETRFPIDDFLRTCTTLRISPYRFLVDNNKTGENLPLKGTLRLSPEQEKHFREIMNMRFDMDAMKRSLDELNRKMAILYKHFHLDINSNEYEAIKDIDMLKVADKTAEYNKKK